MKLNILNFKTDSGIPLIFDNYSGLVIAENENTEHILRQIDSRKEEIIKSLDLKKYELKEFDIEYNFLKKLVENGYFNYESFERVQDKEPMGIYDGMSSHLILITTEDCNLRCKYCVYSDFYKDKKTYSSKTMTIETAIKAVNLFKKYHEEKIKRGYEKRAKINFYGGEPLLNFGVIEAVVNYVNSIDMENVDYLMTTNGTIMNDKILNFLAKNKFLIAFSLDGDVNNHNRNRVTIAGDETHEIIVNQIIKYWELLQKYGNSDQIINITCCYDNYSDMEKISDFFEKFRLKVPNLNVIYNKVYDVDTEYYMYCEKIYKNLLTNSNNYEQSIKKLFKKHYTNNTKYIIPKSVKSLFISYYLLKNRKKGNINLYQGNACVIGDKMSVAPDGKIYICEKANQEVSIGNIDKGIDLGKIEKIYHKFFKIKEEYCMNCPISRLCDVCYVHFIKYDDIVFNKEFCEKRKKSYVRALEFIYSKLYENGKIFDLEDEVLK